MKKVKVSIIVALYNKENTIRKCLDSLLNQTLEDIEIIVVNDASKDNSLEVVKELKNKKIKVINNPKNKGIGYTRNVGIQESCGEYIAFVDADDYVDPKMYESYYNYATTNNLDLINTNYYKIINDKKELFKVPEFVFTNILDNPHIINLINYGPCNKLYKRELIINNDITFAEDTKYEDFIFVAKSIRYAHKIGYLDEAYYNYVIHDKSETTTVDERCFDIFKVLNKANKIYNLLNGTDELDYLNITEITRYMLKQRYQINKGVKKRFIDNGYKHLKNINCNWKNNHYYLKEPLFKRFVKNNKTIMNIYSKM